MIPTGSKDPFALRRAAQGVVKILVEAQAASTISTRCSTASCASFMLERVQYYFREVRGFKYDEVNAVLASGSGTLADVEARLTALARRAADGGFRAAGGELQTHPEYSEAGGVRARRRLFDVQLARSRAGARCCMTRIMRVHER